MYIIHFFPRTHFSVAENHSHRFLSLCNAVALKMVDFFRYLNFLCDILVWNKCEGIFCSSSQHWSKSAFPSKGSLTLLLSSSLSLRSQCPNTFPCCFPRHAFLPFSGMLFRHSSHSCVIFTTIEYICIYFSCIVISQNGLKFKCQTWKIPGSKHRVKVPWH